MTQWSGAAVLPLAFYQRRPEHVARELLGKLLLRQVEGQLLVGRIVETEAYLATGDPASHAFGGRTRRNAAMFGPAGRAYVYALHRCHCLNVVTEAEGVPSAVLIRAVEPLAGLELMQQRRGTARQRDLARGPGRLCQAFAIDRRLDHWDLTRGEGLWLAADATPPPTDVVATPRVGVTAARELPLRFCLRASPFVSPGPRRRSA
ncbi:MAG: putative 3-methyladenine DNA glycosylase [Candidatus Tectimicrobiota bacterium]|nr:MAG: putative 3-methyladenine DNA glycosylase [Candidatus Tectomicrobia bacterium]